MKSPRRTILPVIAIAVLGVGAPAIAADNPSGNAQITAALAPNLIGSRSVVTVAPIALTNAVDSAVATGPLAVTVTEIGRSGTNSWSLTATASNLSDTASHTISNSNLSVSARTVTQTAGGGTSVAPADSDSLASAATLFTNTGQNPALLYSGDYIARGTVTLAVPNGTVAGSYLGTLTVSLI